ncbi:Beta-xylosidase [Pirellulimonas nuda]|uniref:Beta-xylosidase n=1 Tax=Pirellulimonas nuda TaxID=2528009 RepID=A0A518DJG7_9BACT|nr:family 43 glycosylhydrolase [Pirellulimonas nuda]QDU91615.1 Beta-xylosidase [Pirellulimonas nuda]
MLRFTLVLLCLTSAAHAEEFRYQNPITSGIDPQGLRDCQVFRDGDHWYLTGTSSPHWEREPGMNPGVRLYRSDDLLNWAEVGIIVPKPEDTQSWYEERFWAPEVQKINGRYYCTFNCTNPPVQQGQAGGLAVADRVEGPYTVLTPDKPLVQGNDLTLHQEPDGRVYAFWNRGKQHGILSAEVDLETPKLLTEPTTCIRQGEPGEWDSIGIEGAYIVKHRGTYYLMYSSWTRGYEIGYATASSINGPWTKHPGSPIYGAQSRSVAEKNGATYTGDEDCPFNAVGHNEVFTGPDGRLWLSCHGILPGKPPMLVIDPISFEPDGSMKIAGPTHTPQTIPLDLK